MSGCTAEGPYRNPALYHHTSLINDQSRSVSENSIHSLKISIFENSVLEIFIQVVTELWKMNNCLFPPFLDSVPYFAHWRRRRRNIYHSKGVQLHQQWLSSELKTTSGIGPHLVLLSVSLESHSTLAMSLVTIPKPHVEGVSDFQIKYCSPKLQNSIQQCYDLRLKDLNNLLM